MERLVLWITPNKFCNRICERERQTESYFNLLKWHLSTFLRKGSKFPLVVEIILGTQCNSLKGWPNRSYLYPHIVMVLFLHINQHEKVNYMSLKHFRSSVGNLLGTVVELPRLRPEAGLYLQPNHCSCFPYCQFPFLWTAANVPVLQAGYSFVRSDLARRF